MYSIENIKEILLMVCKYKLSIHEPSNCNKYVSNGRSNFVRLTPDKIKIVDLTVDILTK